MIIMEKSEKIFFLIMVFLVIALYYNFAVLQDKNLCIGLYVLIGFLFVGFRFYMCKKYPKKMKDKDKALFPSILGVAGIFYPLAVMFLLMNFSFLKPPIGKLFLVWLLTPATLMLMASAILAKKNLGIRKVNYLRATVFGLGIGDASLFVAKLSPPKGTKFENNVFVKNNQLTVAAKMLFMTLGYSITFTLLFALLIAISFVYFP